MGTASQIHTIGSIARQCGVAVHRVEYILRTRRIDPVGRAASVRLFDEEAVEQIASELRRIDADRATGAAL